VVSPAKTGPGMNRKTFCDTSQIIQIRVNVASVNHGVGVVTNGYYLPRGM
jgi:hypothetical protein